MVFKIILGYLALVSLYSIIITVLDKIKAKTSKSRISEKHLLITSALGGSVMMLLTMLIIRHKTSHAKFMIGIPLIIIVQVFLVLVLYKYLPL